MNGHASPDYMGSVANFSNCALIDGDGVHYFEFALTLASPHVPPDEKVFYVNPKNPNISEVIALVSFAWMSKVQLTVYLDPSAPKMRVRRVGLLGKP